MNPNTTNSVLGVKNLCKNYSGIKAVDNLTFDVKKGEIFGFLGPNGAGKTTTINMICGLLKADSGDIVIDGISIKDDSKGARSLIGMCPQNIVVWKDLTCLEQIEFIGAMYDIPSKTARERGLQLLDVLGLTEKKNKLAKTLSGGMQRRLNIILALVHDPKVLIFDEPEAGLDPQSKVLVRDYIKTLAGKKTIILTTHNMDEAERLADRIAIVDKGRLLTIDTPDNLKNSVGLGDILEIRTSSFTHRSEEKILSEITVFTENAYFSDGLLTVKSPNILEHISSITSILSANNLHIEDVRLRKNTLEDVFISLTGRGLRE